MKVEGKHFSLLVGAGFAALLYDPFPTLAATAPDLGQAKSFGVLAASAVTSTDPSVITGDLGISPNGMSSVTGFPPGIVIGATHFADVVALQAQNDVTAAYNNLASQALLFWVVDGVDGNRHARRPGRVGCKRLA